MSTAKPMKVTPTEVKMLLVENAPGLDPIRVFIENYRPGAGRMVIQCWDRAWSCAWFAMGDCDIEQFVVACNADYIVSNLRTGLFGRLRKPEQKNEDEYTMKIVKVVQEAIRVNIRREIHGEECDRCGGEGSVKPGIQGEATRLCGVCGGTGRVK